MHAPPSPCVPGRKSPETLEQRVSESSKRAATRPPYRVWAAARRHLAAALAALSISIIIIPSPMQIAGMTAHATRLARHAPAGRQCSVCHRPRVGDPGATFGSFERCFESGTPGHAAISGTNAQVPGKCLGHGRPPPLAGRCCNARSLGSRQFPHCAGKLPKRDRRPRSGVPTSPPKTHTRRSLLPKPSTAALRPSQAASKLGPCAVFGGPRRPLSRRDRQSARRPAGEGENHPVGEEGKRGRKKNLSNLLVGVGIARQSPGRVVVSMAGRRQNTQQRPMDGSSPSADN